jgi:predicted O-methyltransferase YrrM
LKENIKQLNIALKEIEGFLTIKEACTLYELARKCSGRGVIIEIGSFKGRSTISLGLGSRKGKNIKIYAIDPHTGTRKKRKLSKNRIWTLDVFKKNISEAGLDDIILPIVKTSISASEDFKQPVELIFLDGDHDYDLVKADFELWFPKLVNGGYIAIHDADWKGPGQVIRKFIIRSRYFKDLRFVDALAFSEKVDTNSFEERFRNRYSYFRYKNHGLFEKMPLSIRTLGRRLIRTIKLK